MMTAYNLSTGSVYDEVGGRWKLIWGLKVPNKTRSFFWLVLHRRIMCNSERFRIGFSLQQQTVISVQVNLRMSLIFLGNVSRLS